MPRDKKRDIIGIDISAEEMTLAYYRVSGRKKEFANLIHYSIQGVGESDIASMLVKALKDLKAKNPCFVAIAPLHLVITKNLEILSLDEQEIREIIDLQSGRQTPYSREEIIIDYITLGIFKQSYTKVLLVIITRAAIKQQLAIMEKAGLKVGKIAFAPECLTRVCMEHIQKGLQNACVGIVHVNLHSTDFIVSLRGLPLFARSIPAGAKHLAQDEERFKTRFLEELKSSLETYQSEDIDASPQLLLLSGATQRMRGWEAMIAAEIKIPVELISYFSIFPLYPKAAAALPPASHDVSFFNTMAAAMSLDALSVDLVPEEIKLKRVFEERAQDLIKMSIYLMVLLVLIGGFFLSRLYLQGMYLAKLNEKNISIESDAVVLKKSMERIRIIKHYLKNRGYSLGIIAALYDVVPKNIMLTSIKVDNEKNVYLKGMAQAMSNVVTFVSAMEESRYFSNVKTNHTASRRDDNEDWVDFSISCILEKK